MIAIARVPYKKSYMVCTDPSVNSNKYYEMLEPSADDNCFVCNYGRVTDSKHGSCGYVTGRKTTWNIAQWTAKYLEKRDKGYTDISSTYYGKEKDITIEKQIVSRSQVVDDEQNRLLAMLRELSSQFMKKTYTIGISRITEEMIKEGYALLEKMQESADLQNLEKFNEYLVKLYMQVPRALINVRREIADNITDIQRFLEREKELLDTLSGNASVEKKIDNAEDIAKTLGVSARLVNDEERKMISNLIEKGKYSNFQSHLIRAWKVTNNQTEKAFNDLLATDDYKGVKPVLLWHGSRSENWFHIVGEGLKIEHANSGMFSAFNSGLYFAPKFSKSEGYTSIYGSHWRGGTEKKAYLALFDVAMGKYREVYDRTSDIGSMNYDRLHKQGYQSIWAKADKGFLMNDECIIYQNNACTIRYIVEIGTDC